MAKTDNIFIEVEGGEIAIENSNGDVAIIPKDKVAYVKKAIEDGCHGCVDSIVQGLPTMSGYAEDGTVIPNEDKQLNSFFPIYKDTGDFYERHKDTKAEVPTYKESVLGSGGITWENTNFFSVNKYGEPNSRQHVMFKVGAVMIDGNCTSEECTARANRAINSLVPNASYFEYSDRTKEKIGASYSVARPPTEEEKAKYPYFEGDELTGSFDARDHIPQIKQKYPKSVLYDSDDNQGNFLTVEESKAYWDKLSVGAYINVGQLDRAGDNMERGSHLVRVVGFLESGEPMIADYGRIVPLSKVMYNDMGDEPIVSGIANVPDRDKYTYNYFKGKRDLVSQTGDSPFMEDTSNLMTFDNKNKVEYVKGDKRFEKLNSTLGKEKNYLATVADIDSDKYDEYAKLAITISGVETKYGTSKASVNWLDKLGESIGVTQLKTENVEKKYSKTLSKYKKNSPEYLAAATVLYIKELDTYKDEWFAHGAEARERPYYLDKRDMIDKAKSLVRQGVQGQKGGGYIDENGHRSFKYSREVEEGKFEDVNIKLPLRTGLETKEAYSKKVNKLFQKQGYTDLRHEVDKNGKSVIYKQTRGTTIEPTLKNMVLYGWQSPGSIYYGDAQGHSMYYKKGMQIYEELFGEDD